jgi:hypothetical protein
MSEDYESEFVASGKNDSVSSCLQNVEAAEAFVCVLDRRYGPPLPAGHSFAGVSATHAEILHARANGKAIFTFVRERSYIDHEQILGDATFKPKWIDPKSKDELAKLIKEQRDLAAAVAAKRSNWFDQFKTSADLKHLVLKRLFDEFPSHVGAFAMRPEKIVRLYFKWTGGNPTGVVFGTFSNAGNGPALDVECGWSTGGVDSKWVTQGAVPVLGDVSSHDHGPPSFACPPGKLDLAMYCMYRNASGDRFRVEAPLPWSNTGYKRVGSEKLFIWAGSVGGRWLAVP